MNLENRLAGKVATITGGGRGLGKGTAERFAAAGGLVVLADVRPRPADDAGFITDTSIPVDGGYLAT